jgi:hypothetical protein
MIPTARKKCLGNIKGNLFYKWPLITKMRKYKIKNFTEAELQRVLDNTEDVERAIRLISFGKITAKEAGIIAKHTRRHISEKNGRR